MIRVTRKTTASTMARLLKREYTAAKPRDANRALELYSEVSDLLDALDEGALHPGAASFDRLVTQLRRVG